MSAVRRHRNALLLIDGLVNLLLGLILLLYPAGLGDALGLPTFQSGFYPTVLGTVLLGIGLALLIERYGAERSMTGLGVAGAIAINLCGGGVLLLWLVVGDLAIPIRGRVVLWIVAVTVLLIGLVETVSGSWREQGGTRGQGFRQPSALDPERSSPGGDTLELREAAVHDAEAVVDLTMAMLQEMASHSPHALRGKDQVRSLLRRRFADSLETDDHTYVVARQEGRKEPVGVVEASVVSPGEIYRSRTILHVHALYVLPSCRRAGIGRRLLEEALTWGRDGGCTEAELSVLMANPGRALYEAVGFEPFELEMRLEL